MNYAEFHIQHYSLPQASQTLGAALEELEHMNTVFLISKFNWSRNYTEQFHFRKSNQSPINPINIPLPLSYFPPFTY